MIHNMPAVYSIHFIQDESVMYKSEPLTPEDIRNERTYLYEIDTARRKLPNGYYDIKVLNITANNYVNRSEIINH